jgi:hypothetical protein
MKGGLEIMKSKLFLLLVITTGIAIISRQPRVEANNPLLTSFQQIRCVNVSSFVITPCSCIVASGFPEVGDARFSGCGRNTVTPSSVTCRPIGSESCLVPNYRVDPCTLGDCELVNDDDGDGWGDTCCGGGDCDDTKFNVRPGRPEICDGDDNNCNGQTDEGFDEDQDEYKTCEGDCVDSDPSTNPAATPDCSTCQHQNPSYGIDRNCNGVDDFQDCIGLGGPCMVDSDCLCDCVCVDGLCSFATPIVIDINGNGFNLTDAAGGVSFDLKGGGSPLQIAWTAANSDDAWLALDRNGNGKIDIRVSFCSPSPFR